MVTCWSERAEPEIAGCENEGVKASSQGSLLEDPKKVNSAGLPNTLLRTMNVNQGALSPVLRSDHLALSPPGDASCLTDRGSYQPQVVLFCSNHLSELSSMCSPSPCNAPRVASGVNKMLCLELPGGLCSSASFFPMLSHVGRHFPRPEFPKALPRSFHCALLVHLTSSGGQTHVSKAAFRGTPPNCIIKH
jgi:hypothetical protein